MDKGTKVKSYSEFNDYYADGKGLVRSKNSDFHIFRFNELGNKVVKKQGPFKTEYFQFALGTSLSSNVSVYNKSFVTEAYSMVIFIPGQIIKWERTGNWDGYVINVKESLINKALIEHQIETYSYLQDMRPLVFNMNSVEYQGLSNIYEMILSEHQKLEPENLMAIKNLMNVLLIYVGRIIKSKNENHLNESPFSYIENSDISLRFKRLVFQNYLENKSVSFYAKELDTTANILNKKVKHVFNKSPKQFINEVLLLHAQTILKNPNSSIKEVSYDLNFDDYSHFVKFFKRMTGMTPAEYKNQFG